MPTKSKNLGKGGRRAGAGRKPKPTAERLNDGKVVELYDFPTSPASSVEMPKASDFLAEPQNDGTPFRAAEIYAQVWDWLSARGCATFVSPNLIELYAVSAARWEQCEKHLSSLGFLAKHPTTEKPIQSPFAAMSQQYANQAGRFWAQIYEVVRDQCVTKYAGGSPQEDLMEQLLNG